MPSPTQRLGAQEEARAERALCRAGYVIEHRNWRGGGGEIDRIAWDEQTLVFVEVRARRAGSHGDPAETVGRGKQRHLIRAAATYLMRFGDRDMPTVRFDVVSVVTDRITIIRDAFEVEPAGPGDAAWML